MMEEEVSPAASEIDRSELAWSRTGVYRLLSMTYARPADERLLELLHFWGNQETEFTQQDLPAVMKRGLREVRAWLKKSGLHPSEVAALGVEFTRLFRGLSRYHSPPPPYESVYREEPGVVFGELAVEVRNEYRRFGLDLTDGFKGELPDHISFELEFLRCLCNKEAEAWERDDEDEALMLLEAERRFLQKHLARWVPAFCENVRNFDTTGFYRGLAGVTEGWICCDQRLIKGLMDL